jgi:hypothetical protein
MRGRPPQTPPIEEKFLKTESTYPDIPLQNT